MLYARKTEIIKLKMYLQVTLKEFKFGKFAGVERKKRKENIMQHPQTSNILTKKLA